VWHYHKGIYHEKQNTISSPDSSGILLWRGSPQEIQRMAGGKVREKMKRMLQIISKTASLFAGTEATPMQVEQYFRTALKKEYQMSIPGARVNFNSMNHTVTPTIFRHK